jgi:hypothetical protein
MIRARICKRYGAQEPIPMNRFRQAGNRFLGSYKGLLLDRYLKTTLTVFPPFWIFAS